MSDSRITVSLITDLLMALGPLDYKPGQATDPLIGNLARCLEVLIDDYPEIVSLSISRDLLNTIINPFIDTPERIRGGIFGEHGYASRLSEANPVYVILTPHESMDGLSDITKFFMAVTFTLTILNIKIPTYHLKRLSAFTRDNDLFLRKTLNTFKLKQSTFENIELLLNFVNSHDSIKSVGRRESLSWILNKIKNIREKELPRPIKIIVTPSIDFKIGDNPVLIPDNTEDVNDYGDHETEDFPLIQTTIVKTDEEPLSLSEEIAYALKGYQVWSTNLFLHHSDKTLTHTEAVQVTKILDKSVAVALSSKDIAQSEAALVIFLMLTTGHEPSYILNAYNLDDIDTEFIEIDVDVVGISPNRGIHLFRVAGNHSFFKAKPNNLSLIGPVSERIQLQFPEEIRILFQRIRNIGSNRSKGSLFFTPPAKLYTNVLNLLQKIRQNQGVPRLTIDRLRFYLPTQIFSQHQDLAMVQMITGQDYRISTSSCHYWCASVDELQKKYSCVTCALLGGKNQSNEKHCDGFNIPNHIGSSIQIFDNLIEIFIDDLKSKANRLRRNKKNVPGWMKNFSDYTLYLCYMFLAGTGHRPTKALHALTLNDFHTTRGLALIADKVSNHGHRSRLIALPEILCNQIQRYASECLSLAKAIKSLPVRMHTHELKEMDSHTLGECIKALEDAGSGKGPLFVKFNMALEACPISNKWLETAIPKDWGVNLNFFRHRMATKLREITNNHSIVYQQLGHFTLGIQPFGLKGVLNPILSSNEISKYINDYLIKDGWQCIGYKNNTNIKYQFDEFWEHGMQIYEKHEQILRNDRNRILKNTFRHTFKKDPTRESTVEDVVCAIRSAIPGYLPENPTHDVNLSIADFGKIMHKLVDGKKGNKSEIAWRINALRKSLNHLRNKYNWKITLPSRAFLVDPEPSPFLMGGLSTLKCLEQITHWLIHEFPEYNTLIDNLGTKVVHPSVEDYEVFRLACFMLFVEGFFQTDRLFETLEGLKGTMRSKYLPSILLTPRIIKIKVKRKIKIIAEVGESLTGITAAVAAGVIENLTSSYKSPSIKTYSRWLHAALPRKMKPKKMNTCWNIFSSLVSVGRRFQVPGLKYTIEAGDILTLGLPENRLIEVIDQLQHTPVYLETDDERETFSNVSTLPVIRKTSKSKTHKTTRQQYNTLTSILYSPKSKRKYFKYINKKLKPKAFKNKLLPRIRDEIEAWLVLDEQTLSESVRALAHWTLYLLSSEGRIYGRGHLKVSSVRTYLMAIADSFIRAFQEEHLFELQPEIFEEKYLNILLSKQVEKRYNTLSKILRFHNFMNKAFAVEEIESTILYAVTDKYPDYPEVGILTEYDFQMSLKVFDHWLNTENKTQQIDLRTVRATKLIWILMYRCGLRISESLSLRHCDFIGNTVLKYISIQNTSIHTTKTSASRRLISLFDRLSESELNLLKTTLSENMQVRGENFTIKDQLFTQWDDSDLLLDWQTISSLISTAIRWGAQDKCARTQWGRHSFSSFGMLTCILPTSRYKNLQNEGVLRPFTSDIDNGVEHLVCQWTGVEGLNNKYPMELSTAIGHASVLTTNTIYSHLNNLWDNPWSIELIQSLSLTEQAKLFSISKQAYLQRCSRYNIDKMNAEGQVTVIIDMCSGKYLNDKYDSVFPIANNNDFPDLPSQIKSINHLTLTNLFDLICNIEDGMPFTAIVARYGLTKKVAESTLLAINSAQRDLNLALVSKEKLIVCFSDIDLKVPIQVTITQTLQPGHRPQRSRLIPLLKLLENLSKIKPDLLNNAVFALFEGQRISHTALALSDTTHVRNLSNLLGSLGIDQTNISLDIVIPTQENDLSLFEELKIEYSQLTGIDSKNINCKCAEPSTQLTQPRFIFKIKEEQFRGRPLWLALLLQKISSSAIQKDGLMNNVSIPGNNRSL